MKIIMGIFAVIMVALYYSGIYFTLFDEESGIDSKSKRIEEYTQGAGGATK